MLKANAAVLAARRKWHYRGASRPAFAEPVGPGEESVWDFPRPPRVEAVSVPITVRAGSSVLAHTLRGRRVLETAGAPTYYFPPEDVARERLIRLGGSTLCEWKGLARGFALGSDLPVAWCYEETFAEFEEIRGWFSFYPGRVDCLHGEVQVVAQPGGYYGGWVTPGLRGPIKGAPGTEHW